MKIAYVTVVGMHINFKSGFMRLTDKDVEYELNIRVTKHLSDTFRFCVENKVLKHDDVNY